MRTELKQSDVVFNPEDHTYKLGDKYLSGITSVLHRQLFPEEFDGIPEEVLQEAAAYGTSVHQSCEDFDSNWYNDGTVEVSDYIEICKNYGLVHECSEYLINNDDYASMIDKCYRTGVSTFSIGDIKSYGVMSPEKKEKARWQLSIYAYLFELQNKKATVDKIFIIHLRNKEKADGTFDHISEVIFLDRIPSDICKSLLDTDLKGEQFINPYSVPMEISEQESYIRELIEMKNTAEQKLAEIKARILAEMEACGVSTWTTDTMRLTRKMPTTRTSFDLKQFKADHPEFNYDDYMKTSVVSGSLLITI